MQMKKTLQKILYCIRDNIWKEEDICEKGKKHLLEW
jgi:hypothetical protein